MSHPPSFSGIVRRIEEICPPGTNCNDPADFEALRALIPALIEAGERDGRVVGDPRDIALSRRVELSDVNVRGMLRDKRVLVTGAAGCVASALIPRLQAFGAGAIIGLDLEPISLDGVEAHRDDVVDIDALERAFA